MDIRHAVRAGSFYEASPSICKNVAAKLLDSVHLADDLPQRLYGGLVPHAGWVYSGHVAAATFRALAGGGEIRTAVLLGADHSGVVHRGEVYDTGAWETPLGKSAVDEPLAAALIGAADWMRSNPRAHAMEHSIEVQVPLLQALWPQCKIVPIAVPPTHLATQIGRTIGQTLARQDPEARVIGSTDLTHHAGHFPAPGGRGEQSETWTTQNDRRMLDLIEAMDAEGIVPEAAEHMIDGLLDAIEGTYK